ncbi:lipopolysaccharide assembly protein LapB [Ideonella livida]|uniref:Lipopolysaccharide assembly protein LapB n=1 Tax=Ideonella livida TaxID=2707176 RepID=A0A7C9TI53_9BURK|nr:lipopolysaccharide assembly protein LapB [Ideonella livida]NDY90164.1 lipopolysaccharide assembly protein LapB [Ideonella livida]
MDLDPRWLLIGLPLAFALGWLASRLDLRQLRGERPDDSRAYHKGLALLLNEQHDKAIDAFIEAVQRDPDSTELHFALGALFRRRGEFERSVRVHQHLLDRADLSEADHHRAQHALAQDFMKAGLLDRAEAAYQALLGSVFDTEARLALLGLYERGRDWSSARDMAGALERHGLGSFANRMAHYWCETAAEREAKGDLEGADEALIKACGVPATTARPWLQRGQFLMRRQRLPAAFEALHEMGLRMPDRLALVAGDYADLAVRTGMQALAQERLQAAYDNAPSLDLLAALCQLDGQVLKSSPRLLQHLQQNPTLSAAQLALASPWLQERGEGDAATAPLTAIGQAVGRAAKPLQRYRCACCGFEAQRHFWQCPGCLSWDSFPPRRLDEA